MNQNPSDIEGILTEMKEYGYDFVKAYSYLNQDVYDEIIRVAKDLDMQEIGHIPFNFDAAHAIKSGHCSDEHFSGYQLHLNSIEYEMGNCPTLYINENNEHISEIQENPMDELKYSHSYYRDVWKDCMYFPYMDLVKILHDKGANIVSGTDSNAFTTGYVITGFSLHEEFRLLNEAGLTPYEVLLTTTVNPAVMLGIANRVGTIEEGKDALVLLNKNPLNNIGNTKAIEGAMRKGIWYSRDELDVLLQKAEENFRN